MSFKVAMTRVAAGMGATQDITTADLGGLTPKAAILIAVQATANNTFRDDAGMSYGFVSGASNQGVMSIFADDNQDSMVCKRRSTTSYCVMLIDDSGSVNGRASFNSWISNGIRISWADNFDNAYFITAIFFAGTQLSASVGKFTPASVQNNSVNVTAPNFRPNFLFFTGGRSTFADTVLNDCFLYMGVCDDSLNQYSTYMRTRNSTGASQNTCEIQQNRAVYDQLGSTALEITAYTGSGFTATTRDANWVANDDILYLALKMANHDNHVQVINPKTSAGNQGYTGYGHTPQFVFIIPTFSTAYASNSECSVGTGKWAQGPYNVEDMITNESSVGVSNTKSLSDNGNIIQHSDDAGSAAAGYTASFVSADADGFTLNFSTTQAPTVLWISATMEEEQPEPTRVPDLMPFFLKNDKSLT